MRRINLEGVFQLLYSAGNDIVHHHVVVTDLQYGTQSFTESTAIIGNMANIERHNIYVRDGLFGEPKCILSDIKVYSAPSIIQWKNYYIMTLEHRVDNSCPWETVITKMDTPMDELKNFVPFLGEWQACCFLHHGFITYSQKGENGWYLKSAKLR